MVFSNITRCIQKVEFSLPFKGGISELMAFSTNVKKFAHFTAYVSLSSLS